MFSSTRVIMEKVSPTQEPPPPRQQLNQQGSFKCPRCDSFDTKFCYYNNYSLSQPRHFCKVCKRYWTRGGTLRNVPVGGGCRKNKRAKRPANTSLEGAKTLTLTSTGNTTASNANPSYINNPTVPTTSQSQMDSIPSASNHINPLLFGLSSNPSELNLPFPTKFKPSSKVSSTSMDGFDLQPQLNAIGLGSSSGLIMSSSNTGDVADTSFIDPNKRIIDVLATATTSIPLIPSYSSIFGSSSSRSPTMAALLASSFFQQKVNVKETTKAHLDHFQTSTTKPFGGMQMNGNGESGDVSKRMKVEPAGKSRLDWNLSYQNQLQRVGFADPNSLYWNNNSSVVDAWNDSANIGP